MPTIDHAALWVSDLERARDFYAHWFQGRPNGIYINPRTGLHSYVLRFEELGSPRTTRLEIMQRPDVVEHPEGDVRGWAHISFAFPGRDDVDRLAAEMKEAGVEVVDGPRQTGDGYYETALLDPEGNRVELLAADYSEEVALRERA